jgi:hypothetical protein
MRGRPARGRRSVRALLRWPRTHKRRNLTGSSVPVPELSRARAAARSTLLTVGILCIVPQGPMPIGFNLFGVDPQVKVWFAARYLPQHLQVPVAAAFIAAGALAIWVAVTIQRKPIGAQ